MRSKILQTSLYQAKQLPRAGFPWLNMADSFQQDGGHCHIHVAICSKASVDFKTDVDESSGRCAATHQRYGACFLCLSFHMEKMLLFFNEEAMYCVCHSN